MATKTLGFLGGAANRARRAGLGDAVDLVVDALDRLLLRTKVAPLRATCRGASLRGYLRHRSFLAYVDSGMPNERHYQDLLLRTIHEETTFVDGGAHIGLYTVLGSRRARRVVAFEPDPYNLTALRANVARARCTNVEVRADALADRSGSASFRAFRSTIGSSLIARKAGKYHEVEVDLAALDDVLDPGDLEDLVIKLDVEGAERLALAGMRNTIRDARNLRIFVEVNPSALEAGGASAEDLLADLRATHFHCAEVDEQRSALTPLVKGWQRKTGNVLCEKSADDKDHLPD